MVIPSDWINDETAYTINDIDTILSKIRTQCAYVGENIKYLNIPIAFDIETTSFRDHDEKCAIMYVWMIGIFGFVIIGRTWDEYMIAYYKITSFFRTCGNARHMIWFIHNASFDFQFVRKHHNFINVFASGRYAPLYAVTVEGVEFRCSYRLASLSLEKVAKNLRHHTIAKMSGDLDYRKIRHTKTPLTETELRYCTHDVKVVCAYIAECITDEGENISTIPLTNTGYVRRDCRNACLHTWGYHGLMQNLILTPQEFDLCHNAFMGGYVHSNPVQSRIVINDVTSLDISSSYPTVMVAERFPMSAPKHVIITKWSDFKYYLSKYCCIFSVTLVDVQPRFHFDYYLSASKCELRGNRTLSNGRVAYADELTTTLTDVDWDIVEYMYKLHPKNIQINEFVYFERDYLPTPLVKQVLTYYEKKTTLADKPEYKAEYDKAKRMLNSTYGMCATNPIREEVYYTDNEWSELIAPNAEKAVAKYNRAWNRFLYYPWAVYITAYARHNIWAAIIECGDDHIYSDTDSEKCVNFSAHAEFFARYNADIQARLKLACKVHGLPETMIKPRNKDGKEKPLGIFKNEGTYSKFKTNGAKRYMYVLDGDIHMVCSGVNPKTAITYLKNRYHTHNEILCAFDDELTIPSEYSGRLIHSYIDERRHGYITDYLGNRAEYEELSAVHLEPSDYNFSISREFIDFISGLKGELFKA